MCIARMAHARLHRLIERMAAFIVPDINKADCIGLTWVEMTDD
jgi:hypothetical protein